VAIEWNAHQQLDDVDEGVRIAPPDRAIHLAWEDLSTLEFCYSKSQRAGQIPICFGQSPAQGVQDNPVSSAARAG